MPAENQFSKSLTALAIFFAVLFPVTNAAAGVQKGPYLQWLTSDSVEVRCELSDPQPLVVSVTTDGKPAREFRAAAAAFHAIAVTGLSPATTYAYEARAGEDVRRGTFRTAPNVAGPVRFLVYGDTRSQPDAHAAVVRAMMEVPSDFLVHTGDMVARGDHDDDWKSFFTVEGELLGHRSVLATVGNHELAVSSAGGTLPFLQYFGPRTASKTEPNVAPELYGTYRWGHVFFLLLNAMDDFSSDDRAWIERALAAAAKDETLRFRFAVLHHGPFSSGPHGPNPRLSDGRVVGLLQKGGIDLVFAGHDHVYERGESSGLKYIVSGGSGAPLYPRKRSEASTLFFESAYHFVEVAIDGDVIKTRAIRPTGAVIETCTTRKEQRWECERPAAPSLPASASAAAPTRGSMVELPPSRVGGSRCGCDVPGAPSTRSPAFWMMGLIGLACVRQRRSR